MIGQVHHHIVSELQQGARADTVLVIVAVLPSLLMLGISSGIAQESAEKGTTTAVLVLFMALMVCVPALGDVVSSGALMAVPARSSRPPLRYLRTRQDTPRSSRSALDRRQGRQRGHEARERR